MLYLQAFLFILDTVTLFRLDIETSSRDDNIYGGKSSKSHAHHLLRPRGRRGPHSPTQNRRLTNTTSLPHERTEKKQVLSHGMFQRPCLNTACSLASLRGELDIQATLLNPGPFVHQQAIGKRCLMFHGNRCFGNFPKGQECHEMD
jgi:hypothetical protein